jgi:hypothetical protein
MLTSKQKNMLRNKSNKVFSETNNFFASSEKGIFRIMKLYRSLQLNRLSFGVKEFPQSTFRKGDLLLMMLLFPIYSLSNVYRYTKHPLSQRIEASKNTFYRLKNDCRFNWRSLMYKINNKLFKHTFDLNTKDKSLHKCLIIDDTDFEKTTYKTEHLGKIWSHVKHRQFWGFKGLFLGYWDGKSFFSLDFSLHKEKGKNKKTPYGLTAKRKKAQYTKKREKGSAGFIREKELTKDKISTALSMIKRVMKQKLDVQYVLMDSWFFCESILKEILSLTHGIHIVGMIKMAKAKYTFNGNKYTAKELSQLLKQRKKVKRVKQLNLFCAEIEVEYKSIPLKLYFCKNTRRGKYHLLGSTDTKLGILEAYKIYSIRWSIEVFFKESKQYFGLGKSKSQDFDAQIADISLAMIGYNVFSFAKRFDAYESMGQLFEKVCDDAIELTISLRMWKFILELLQIIAEFIDGDFNELIVRLMKNKPEENKIFRLIEMKLVNAA